MKCFESPRCHCCVQRDIKLAFISNFNPSNIFQRILPMHFFWQLCNMTECAFPKASNFHKWKDIFSVDCVFDALLNVQWQFIKSFARTLGTYINTCLFQSFKQSFLMLRFFSWCYIFIKLMDRCNIWLCVSTGLFSFDSNKLWTCALYKKTYHKMMTNNTEKLNIKTTKFINLKRKKLPENIKILWDHIII